MKLKTTLIIALLISFKSISQVHLQKGAVQYSYPIVDYMDPGNRIGTSVSLQYVSGNGIKVNEIASDVGLGWALNAGGFIQRIQNGEPDDQNSTDLFPISDQCTNNSGSFNWTNSFRIYEGAASNYVDNYFPNGFLYTEFPVANGMTSCNIPSELAVSPRFPHTTNLGRKWKRSKRSLADRSQDEFVFNFNGRTGIFYIGRDGSILITQDSKLKISIQTLNMLSQNIRTRISEFKIIDENGIQYVFKTLELTEIVKLKVISTITNQQYGNLSFVPSYTLSMRIINGDPIGKYIINRWMLTEIVNPKTNKKIEFQYEDVNMDFVPSVSTSLVNANNGKKALEIIEQRTVVRKKQLNAIVTPDNYKIEFEYTGENRTDEGGQLTKPLTGIKYLYDQNLINYWKFDYRYFFKKDLISISTGNQKNEDDRRYLRLCLRSISKAGADGIAKTQPLTFDYYTGAESSLTYEIVPPLKSFAQDHWGYYTTPSFEQYVLNKYPEMPYIVEAFEGAVLRKVRAPNADFAKLGMLKKITYETGGFFKYEYEQNTGPNGVLSKDNLISNSVGGVRVSKTIISDGINFSKDQIVGYEYKKPDGTSSGWGNEPLVYSVTKTAMTYPDADGYNYNGDESIDYSSSILPGQISANYIPRGFDGFVRSFVSACLNPGATLSYFLTYLFTTSPSNIQTSTVLQYDWVPFSLQNPIDFQYSRVVKKKYIREYFDWFNRNRIYRP